MIGILIPECFDKLLDRWLADPQAILPGTEMEFVLESAQQRPDVIAYLIAAGKR